ncbi:NF038130 family PEP-CTERM protein [Leptothoe sp. PORK10 BA2]|uniref:NF038130 family PEP-CTERM protein n=1 Tax=Leptothoe sp. PORK10 BA2 TaxID=3110254 RepID=UPI002B1EF53C|nr:NF038130 family PEP-CTERM protein [Leptothoe sp. PORK10 BA2]MEA5466512.1 NF038130 family PEP-CTERM protein [Leptothoe sp. PORK10 BA2]
MKNCFYSSVVVLGFVALGALPAAAQTTSGTVEIFNEVAPGVVAPGGTAADALNGIGNIELGETDGGLDGFQGSLTLGLGGGALTLSSLTQADWDGGLADRWFDDAWSVYGADIAPLLTLGGLTRADLRTAFDVVGADARLSDPNIESVMELGTGDVDITLAGFVELNSLIDIAAASLGLGSFLSLLPPLPTFFASEVVAYEYQGTSGFLYSIGESPTPSGVVSADGTNSFTGNYTVTLGGTPPSTSVPEPSTLLGLAGAAVAAAWGRRQRRSV